MGSDEFDEKQLEKIRAAVLKVTLENELMESEILTEDDLVDDSKVSEPDGHQGQGLTDESLLAERFSVEQTKLSSPEVPIEITPEEVEASLEAVFFVSDKPLKISRILEILPVSSALIMQSIDNLQARFRENRCGIELVEVDQGYQLRTKISQSEVLKKLTKTQIQRLSSGAMETLSIIAYKQPVMKEDIDQVRGVDSSYFLRTLLDRKLVKISGRSELPGRPMLYETTPDFLELFGLRDLANLPSLREIEQMAQGMPLKLFDENDPRLKEMRSLINEMGNPENQKMGYDPAEDELILKEIRDRVQKIPVSCPTIEEQKVLEKQKELDLKKETVIPGQNSLL